MQRLFLLHGNSLHTKWIGPNTLAYTSAKLQYVSKLVKFYKNRQMKCAHVPDIETIFETGIFLTAQLHQKNTLAYKMRLYYFYGNTT